MESKLLDVLSFKPFPGAHFISRLTSTSRKVGRFRPKVLGGNCSHEFKIPEVIQSYVFQNVFQFENSTR